MYPWQIYVGITDQFDIGASFEEFYRPWGSKMLMNLHYYNAPNAIGTLWDTDRNRRVSFISTLLARTFWDPNMYEGSEGIWAPDNLVQPVFPGARDGAHPEEIHVSRESHALESLEPVAF